MSQQPIEQPSANNQENHPAQQPFESDTQRIIHRHLENEHDIITEEDIRNVRIGATPAVPDGPTEELIREYEDKTEEADGENVPENQKTTPWDVISDDD
jgi:hypothetical protein